MLASEGAAFIVRTMLEAHPRPGDAIQGLDLSSRRRLAWKTGTSYGHRDSWAIGVTPAYTIGVWVGRPDGTPLPGHYGAATAAPLLFALVDALPRHADDTRIAVPPPNVALREICWPLGRAASETPAASCHDRRDAWVLGGSIPPTFAPYAANGDEAQSVSYLRERTSGLRVRADCATGEIERAEHARWPALAEPWLDAGRRAKQRPPDWSRACRVAASPHRALRIAGLDAGTTIAPPSNVRRIPSVSVRALGASGDVSWLLDGRLVARTRGDAPIELALEQAGERIVVAVDTEGRYDRVAVRVLR